MKKPKKKEMSCKECNGKDEIKCATQEGYNQACDEWEKFLPSKKDIYALLLDYDFKLISDVAEAIHKRITTL